MIKIKRAYEPFEKSDGFRILVDRLWPRGITKEDLHADIWLKEIAPSDTLRKWFHHDATSNWKDFRTKYLSELKHSTAIDNLQTIIKEHKLITLVYGAKDEVHNQAAVIKEFLEQ